MAPGATTWHRVPRIVAAPKVGSNEPKLISKLPQTLNPRILESLNRTQKPRIPETLKPRSRELTLPYIYIYIYIYITPYPPGLGCRIGSLGRCFLEPCWAVLGSKLEAWEGFLESILGLLGVWEAMRQQGRGLEGLGLPQGSRGGWGPGNGPNMSPT